MVVLGELLVELHLLLIDALLEVVTGVLECLLFLFLGLVVEDKLAHVLAHLG